MLSQLAPGGALSAALLRQGAVPLLRALQRGLASSALSAAASAQPLPAEPAAQQQQPAPPLAPPPPTERAARLSRLGRAGYDFAHAARPQRPEDVPEVVGSVHSIESFSALDGPGVRFLVFVQGCGLRCVFCSNPDTWHMARGKLTSSKDLAKKLERVSPYLKQGSSGKGGITISGGEPLLQPEFTASVLMEAHARGLTTCIDTTGQGMKESHWDKVLPHLDYALFCIKSPIPDKYEWITKRQIGPALGFVEELEKRGIPYWLRYVLMSGHTDQQEDIDAMVEFCCDKKSMQAVEVLPYHLLGVEKWAAEGKEYPLKGMQSPSEAEVKRFLDGLKAGGVKVLCNKFSNTTEE
ncbi:pyruvate formate-lyase 1-activating enzyme [Micractinium conductrix]|uniref:Pyruvate formate-lyase 1-activating enzyme n=1 Tax=Micractinium conductrix TaxID=554055 RepID=A0A2P6V9F6_9CHLO|nr:pyruvate formate-lyase 1-activating enzyme [Micractinium conductrix]|eukprot:PSC70718.1 pyruvate formate-lyase 1-activating enzyme [Micractinium conductrix]